MTSPDILPLSELDSGDSGKVVEISGGLGIRRKVEAMGIRPGKSITKVSGMFMRGPVVAKVDRMQVAIGWGMARKIMVQVNHR
jgi:ferrous iron transport protein A